VLLPKHLFYGKDGLELRNTKDVTYVHSFLINGVYRQIEFDRKRLIYLSTTGGLLAYDAALYDVSHSDIPHLRSALHHFISDKHLALVKDNLHATMVGYTIVNGKPVAMQRSFPVKLLKKTIHYDHAPNLQFSISSGITYEAGTVAGDCGNVVLIHHPQIPNKAVGIHVFGSPRDLYGGAVIVTQELLARHLPVEQEKPDIPHGISFSVTDRIGALRSQGFSLEVVGLLDQPIYVGRDTEFVTTPLLEILPKEGLGYPSAKFVHEGMDPLLVGSFLYGSDLYTITSEFDDEVSVYLQNKFKAHSARVFNALEAVNAQGGMDRLNLNTSAGYGHVQFGRNKRFYFDVCERTGILSFKTEEYRELVQRYIDDYQHVGREIVWISSLKDELIKPGKLARVFQIPPLEYTIASRAYFGSWIDMMHTTVGQHFCCVGITPESMQWNDLIYSLLRKSDKGVDADAPNWDKNLMTKLVFIGAVEINKWYKLNDPNWKLAHDNARLRLIEGFCHGYVVAGDLLLRKFKGMPSGHVLTALMNSLVNMIMHLIWYLKSVPIARRSVAFYDEDVVTYVYGDDSIDAIVEEMLPYLNRTTMMAAYQRYCTMTITSSQKDGTLRPYDNILDLSFLKRDTRRDGLVYKPLLAKRSLYSMLGHVRKSKHCALEDQLIQNLKTFFGFAYFYGPEFYNGHLACFGRLFPGVLFPAYSYYDSLFRHGEIFKELSF
jgi:hypothetical protein